MTRHDVLEALIRAGWHRGRSTPTDPAMAALTAEGYVTSPALSRFLGEFSGLTVQYVRNGRPDTVWVDAVRACAWADRASMCIYEDRLHVSLAPIGFAYHDHMLLMAAVDGRFFGGYDDFMVSLGQSGLEMFETVLAERGEELTTDD